MCDGRDNETYVLGESPVLLRVEELVVEAAPLDRRQSSACYGYTWEAAAHVERVVEQVKAGVRAVSHDPVDDGLRKGLSAGSGVQTGLRLSRALGASDLRRVIKRSCSVSAHNSQYDEANEQRRHIRLRCCTARRSSA